MQMKKLLYSDWITCHIKLRKWAAVEETLIKSRRTMCSDLECIWNCSRGKKKKKWEKNLVSNYIQKAVAGSRHSHSQKSASLLEEAWYQSDTRIFLNGFCFAFCKVFTVAWLPDVQCKFMAIGKKDKIYKYIHK